MKQEDKQLLLKDLSAKLPYGVMLKIGEHSDYKLIGIVITDEHPIKVEVIENGIPYKIEVSIDIVKPILRSMSSMTEEEKNEHFGRTMTIDIVQTSKEVIDWLNKKMFDYSGLIEKGLAVEVTEENNPYKS